MKYIIAAVAALCSSQLAWGQSAPPPQSSTQSIGKPHVCSHDYPLDAIVAGEQGTTVIGFRITTAGTVSELHVVKSSGSKLLDDAALNCAASWRYKPAMKDGQPVEVPWKAEVRWVLDLPLPDPAAQEGFRACAATYAGRQPPLLPEDASTEVLVMLSSGVPMDARIRHASGFAELDKHALACARKEWKGELGTGFQTLSVRWSEVLKPAK